jgi:hypothetical protein
MIESFEWSANGDLLTLDLGTFRTELWTYTIVNDVLTINSRQAPGLRYSYIRVGGTGQFAPIDIPNIVIPDFDIPDVSIPEIDIPDINLPADLLGTQVTTESADEID